MGYIFRVLARSRRRVQYVGNIKNEKNISHIARRCHVVTGLSLGALQAWFPLSNLCKVSDKYLP